MPKRTRKITKSLVDSLGPHSTIWDSEIVGFGVRRQRRHAVFVLKTIINKRQVFKTIGKHGSPWTVHLARQEATRLLTEICVGAVGRQIYNRNQPRRAVRELCTRYLSEYAVSKTARSQRGDESLVRNHIIPVLGNKHVSDVTKADIVALRNAVSEGKTASANPKLVQLRNKGGNPAKGGRDVANRCVSLALRIFNVAEDLEWRPQNSNPARRIQKFRGSA